MMTLLTHTGVSSSARRVRGLAVIQAIRPQQWVKNTLLFAPILLAHQVSDLATLQAVVLAFFAFSLCASAVYVMNDLLDLEADRRHPVKRHRPFASGALPLGLGPTLACGFGVAGLALAFGTLSWAFLAVLAGYLVLTSAYSFRLKRIAIVDVIVLAGLYTLRLVAGGVAAAVPVSEWLMAFSMFLFISLAFAKRYAELVRLSAEGKAGAEGRGYMVTDVGLLESVGPTCGYLAVLVFALYINSDAVQRLYTHLWALWGICPLLFYWISRIWLLARRGELHEDPVVFAMKDRVSLVAGVLTAMLGAIAAGVR